jgi:exodeoxyribonuclease VII small subunit
MAKRSKAEQADTTGAAGGDPVDLAKLPYEVKEARLEEILVRLDNSETPMDELASEAREAAALILSMHETLRATRQEITSVFEELERRKESIDGD